MDSAAKGSGGRTCGGVDSAAEGPGGEDLAGDQGWTLNGE